MPDLLREIGIDPALLESQNDGAPVEFEADEDESLRKMALGLFRNLSGSDFSIAFPGREAICTLHHHKQLWWTTTDPSLAQALGNTIAA
jgi:hypothetical protein